MRKIIIFFIILTIIGTVSLVAINLRKDSSHTDDTSEAEISQPIDLSGLDSYQPVSGSVATVTNAGADEKPASQSFTISMNFVGDIMLAGNDTATSSIDAMANSQPSTYFFENVRDYFLNDDITIANCENVFSDNDNLAKTDKGEAAALEQYNNAVAEYNSAVALAQQSGTTVSMEKPEYTFRAFWFRSHAATAKLLPENGVDIVSIDNNHTYDFGTDGNMDTRAALDVAGVDWGKDGKIVYKEINGFKIAFVFGSMYSAGAEQAMLVDLEEANANSDYQVVYFHGGEEKVHGSHPHVLQPMETYNGVNIVYSLGNFIFGGNNYPENRTLIYNQTLTITQDAATGGFTVANTDITLIPCYVYTGESNNYQPAVIENETDKQLVIDFMQGKRELLFSSILFSFFAHSLAAFCRLCLTEFLNLRKHRGVIPLK